MSGERTLIDATTRDYLRRRVSGAKRQRVPIEKDAAKRGLAFEAFESAGGDFYGALAFALDYRAAAQRLKDEAA